MSDEDYEELSDTSGNYDENFGFGKVKTWGKKACVQGTTVSHGLGGTPDHIVITPEAGGRFCGVYNLGATTFGVKVFRMNFGTVSITGSGTVGHSLGEVPLAAFANSANTTYTADVTGKTSSNITISVRDVATGNPALVAVNIDWLALVKPGSDTTDVHWMALGD